MIFRPVSVDPVNMTFATSGCDAESRAHVAVARDSDEHIGGRTSFITESMASTLRGVKLARLDDDRVAHAKRRTDLPDRDHQRPVPGADRTDDADGL